MSLLKLQFSEAPAEGLQFSEQLLSVIRTIVRNILLYLKKSDEFARYEYNPVVSAKIIIIIKKANKSSFATDVSAQSLCVG
jgi:hypothetical protein